MERQCLDFFEARTDTPGPAEEIMKLSISNASQKISRLIGGCLQRKRSKKFTLVAVPLGPKLVPTAGQ